jgi:hypothetical protein
MRRKTNTQHTTPPHSSEQTRERTRESVSFFETVFPRIRKTNETAVVALVAVEV